MLLKIFENKSFVDVFNIRKIKGFDPRKMNVVLEKLLKKLVKAEKEAISSIMNLMRRFVGSHRKKRQKKFREVLRWFIIDEFEKNSKSDEGLKKL